MGICDFIQVLYFIVTKIKIKKTPNWTVQFSDCAHLAYKFNNLLELKFNNQEGCLPSQPILHRGFFLCLSAFFNEASFTNSTQSKAIISPLICPYFMPPACKPYFVDHSRAPPFCTRLRVSPEYLFGSIQHSPT